MASDQQWSNGNWRVLSVAVEPRMQRELSLLLRATLPTSPVQEIGNYPDAAALQNALNAHQPNVCFVDLAGHTETGLSLINLINRTDPGIGVVALLQSNHPELILKSLRQGASEFMLMPFSDEQLQGALNKLMRVLPKEKIEPPNMAKCIAVFPAKGACGATTIAACLAFQIKRLGHKKVLLADMDPLAGTISFILKVKSNYSFMDVFHRGGDMDQDLWKAMVTTRENIDVLLSPEAISEATMDLQDARPILTYARLHYDAVVMDAGSPYGAWNPAPAQVADEILLITTNELTSMQGAQRALGYLLENEVPVEKIRIVVNRFSRDAGLSREVISTALNMDIFEVIPSDYDTIQKSLLEGKPIASSTGVGKSIGQIAEKIMGRKETAKEPAKVSTSKLSSLLSYFGRQ